MSDARRLASSAEVAIVEGLRDEATFMMLVDQHQAVMLRIAQMYVSSRAVAEEVVQEAWLGIVKGLDRFEVGRRCAPGCFASCRTSRKRGARPRAGLSSSRRSPVREVIRLRDVHGWSSEDVCDALDISASNQRVLLHRARTRVRRELDAHLSGGSEAT